MTRGEWNFEQDVPAIAQGTAEAERAQGPSPAADAGRLYIPDLEQRRGWREYYVKRLAPSIERSVGFRKPGQR